MSPNDYDLIEAILWLALAAWSVSATRQIYSIDPVYDPKKEGRKPKRIHHE